MKVIYPGSFDPTTLGHMDIIKRSSDKFALLVVSVLHNPEKNNLFSIDERLEMLDELTSDMPNVVVDVHDGLLIDYAKLVHADAIVRGLRAVSDFEYEMQMSLYNKNLNPDIETFFLVSQEHYSYLSSSIVKEVASYGGDVSRFVPPLVERKLKEKYREKYEERERENY